MTRGSMIYTTLLLCPTDFTRPKTIKPASCRWIRVLFTFASHLVCKFRNDSTKSAYTRRLRAVRCLLFARYCIYVLYTCAFLLPYRVAFSVKYCSPYKDELFFSFRFCFSLSFLGLDRLRIPAPPPSTTYTSGQVNIASTLRQHYVLELDLLLKYSS